MPATDESWADVARSTREALALLGHPIESRCLPDEADPCGPGYALHAAAHFGIIEAVITHQLHHLGSDHYAAFDEIRLHTLAELQADCGGPREDAETGGRK